MLPLCRRFGLGLLAVLIALPVSSQVIAPEDLEYKGAFRLPQGNYGGSTWAYGGWALTYYPAGDPNGPADGYPGSLYGVGHDWDQLVAEISIPAPVISLSKNANELPIASILQPFSDITDGLINQGNPDKLGGLAYLPRQGSQNSDKVHWSVFEYYNASANDNYGHGWAELDLSNPQAQGLWHLGPMGSSAFHSMKTGNYLFDIPESWADAYVGRKMLAAGRSREAGAFGSSQGPPLFAYGPYDDGNPPPDQSELEATALLYYPAGEGHYPSYSECDDWDGGAWLTAGDNSAVVFVGSKGLGPTYYGDARPQDCTGSKGYHCTPYEAQIVFYDPDELAAVAAGALQPWEVVPYAILRPGQHLFPDCDYKVGGAAFDRDGGLLYVIQKLADNAAAGYPIVHVFQVHETGASGKHTLTLSKTGSGTGSVVSSPAGIDCGSECAQEYDTGSVVSLSATPDLGSTFSGWSGHSDCNDGIVSMDGFRVCRAEFSSESQNYTLSVGLAGSGEGTVTSAPPGIECGVDCEEDYPMGTAVQMYALPAPGSSFIGWSGDSECADGIVPIESNHTCSALFQQAGGACTGLVQLDSWSTSPGSEYDLTTASVGTEIYTDRAYTITSISSGLQNETLIQTANDDKAISDPNHLTFTLCEDATVYLAYDLRATSLPDFLEGPGWTISGETLETSHSLADEVHAKSFAAGVVVLGGNLDGGPTGASSNYSVIIKPSTLTPHELVVTKPGAGSGTVVSNPPGILCGGDCLETYDHGSIVQLTATPDTGSVFDKWSANCEGGMVNLNSATTCQATFLTSSSTPPQVPSQADWTDHGTIFNRGANGSWDYYLDGAFASTIVKKNGTFFLYYQGASGFRSEDGTVTHRSLGVATSSDGFSFTKHPGNPILSWSPTGNPEEGFFSATAFLQDDGEIDLYWGALTSPNSTSLAVSGDGRLATGFDPLALTDLTEVLDHNDASVWGWGDELSPISAFEHNGTWYVYYVPNGTPQGHTLGLAWGPSRTQLTNSAPVTSGGLTIAVWGSATYVPIDSDTFALFLNNEGTIQVRTGTYAAPTQLSAPIKTYQFPEVSEEAAIFLDTDANTWFLYYRHPNLQRYGVKTAPNIDCTATAIDLTDLQIDDTRSYYACSKITVGANVVLLGPTADVVLRAGSSVTIDNGLTVETGAELQIIVDIP